MILWLCIEGVFLFLFKQVLIVLHYIQFGGVSFLTFCLGACFIGLIFKIFLEHDPFAIESKEHSSNSDSDSHYKPQHAYNRWFSRRQYNDYRSFKLKSKYGRHAKF